MPSSPEMRANFQRLYTDIFWFGVLAGSTLAFLTVYTARLGATAFQIGLLTAGPAFVNLLFSLPAGRWMESHSLIRVTFWSAALHRLGYLVLILLPMLFTGQAQIIVISLVIFMMSVPGTLLAISFNAMFADVVPPDSRAEVVGKRNAILAISMTCTTLLCGWLLDTIAFPANYQVVFGIGAIGAGLSTYQIRRLRPAAASTSARAHQPVGSRFFVELLSFLRFSLPRSRFRPMMDPVLRLDRLRRPFGPFLAAYFIFYTFQYMPLALFPLAFVNLLQLTDGAISLGNGLFYAMMSLASLRLSWLSARYGHRRILVTSALVFCQYPLLLGLARGPALYWIASLAGGVIYGLLSASLLNRLMERVPEDERPAHMALHNLALNLGILIGSLSGPALSGMIGLREALLVSAGLRLLAGFLLTLWG